MSSRLVNVRLDGERLRKVEALRSKGIALSDLLRAAIDERYRQVLSSRRRPDVRAILARLDAEFPISRRDLPARRHDVHDRRSAAAAIRKRLRGRRRSR